MSEKQIRRKHQKVLQDTLSIRKNFLSRNILRNQLRNIVRNSAQQVARITLCIKNFSKEHNQQQPGS